MKPCWWKGKYVNEINMSNTVLNVTALIWHKDLCTYSSEVPEFGWKWVGKTRKCMSHFQSFPPEHVPNSDPVKYHVPAMKAHCNRNCIMQWELVISCCDLSELLIFLFWRKNIYITESMPWAILVDSGFQSLFPLPRRQYFRIGSVLFPLISVWCWFTV